MNALVIDASIAIKWVVEEDGTSGVLILRQKAKLIAPDLLVAECANIFWKKSQHSEQPTPEQAVAAVVQQLPSVTAEQINSVARLDFVCRTSNQGSWTINFADWVELP
jgi:predicted nucleic acid-binding protein